MRVIALKNIRDFCLRHADAGAALKAWTQEARTASWKTPHDIRHRYRNASFLGRNRVVFNIKGNDYRLVVAVAYRFEAVYVKFIGTHAQYDAIDAETVEMEWTTWTSAPSIPKPITRRHSRPLPFTSTMNRNPAPKMPIVLKC
ncbi:MAG: type II toxin-antitoxin system HigB family toxin [Ramlibacter sp.]